MSKDQQPKQATEKPQSKRPNTRPKRRRKPHSKAEAPTRDADALIPTRDDVNDSSYYYDDELIKNQITNYSFNEFAGVNFKIGDGSQDNVGFQGMVAVPTLMRVETMIMAGASNNPAYVGDQFNTQVTDGVTRAGLKNYYRLSAGNAKTTNYQPQDVTMLIFALSSVMEQISYIQRVFGSVSIFNVRNRDLPKRLITLQGINYVDFTNNLANYRLRFNVILNLLNKIPIPSNVKAFMKSNAMYQNIYVDDASPMAQMILMCPAGYWNFDEANAQLTWVAKDYTIVRTMGQTLNDLETTINYILNSATFNYIYADILRLAQKGEMNLLQYGTIPENYVAPVTYSEEFNLWLNNLTIVAKPGEGIEDYSTASNNVYQDIDNNTLRYCPSTTKSTAMDRLFLFDQFIVNFTTNNPDTEAKIAATRLITALRDGRTYGDPSGISYHYVAGTHAVTGLYIFGRNASNGDDVNAIGDSKRVFNESISTLPVFADTIKKMSDLSKFKHAPRYYVIAKEDGVFKEVNFVNDLDFYTTVDVKYLQRLFDTEWIAYLVIG